MSGLDIALTKKDFPILEREVNGKRLVYLDSASSSQKPNAVLDAMDRLYREYYANVHRGVYQIAAEASDAYEAARASVARFIGAPDTRELVFTRNATEAINLVAYSWGRSFLRPGDAVVLTEMEHHANIVPWQILAAERGIELRWVPMTDAYELDRAALPALLDGAALFAFTAMSNVLGTINDVPELATLARAAGARVLVDACQSIPHMPTNVAQWDADFVAFSAHKMCGPSGVGALWARAELLEAMPPFLGGGDMIRDVTFDGFTSNDIPWKFEAGTPAIAEVIGFGAAAEYLDHIGMTRVRNHERELTTYALNALTHAFGETLRIYGPTDIDRREGAISFLFEGIHAHDISQVLDEAGVCVRAGHHCAKPLMRRLGVPATSRASSYIYNDEADIDALVSALDRAAAFFVL
ncbi:MAG: cysteine desulfurase [Acidimicrobiia bacterium]